MSYAFSLKTSCPSILMMRSVRVRFVATVSAHIEAISRLLCPLPLKSSPLSMKVDRGGAASSAPKLSAVLVAFVTNPDAAAPSLEPGCVGSAASVPASVVASAAPAGCALRSSNISSASSFMPSSHSPSPVPVDLKTRSAPNLSILRSSEEDSVSSCAAAAVLPRPTIWSRYSLRSARCWMRSSTVPSVHSRYTWTGLVCPMRCTLAMACRSTCGFQSESKRMHVSAV
mmetsp:Transcript_7185/g.17854  ORF Transcript_7185/g.17854 Transcript_7185/m.17854 type:complete len:228 (-) Transcript_7185:201-884(-)